MNVPLIVAHRAKTPGATENSPAAIALATTQGADLIELDLRLSLDRRPVLLHDAMLRRTTRGRGWVRLWPALALDRLGIREGEGERVTRLESVFHQLPERAHLALHLKDRAALGPVLRLIEQFGLANRTWLWLEHMRDVWVAKRALPSLRVTLLRPAGWQAEQFSRYVGEAQWSGASGISLPAQVIESAHVLLANQHQLRVFSRIDTPDAAPGLAALGVGGLITTDPAAVRKVLDGASFPE